MGAINALNTERTAFFELADAKSEQSLIYMQKTKVYAGVPEKIMKEARNILSEHYEDERFRYTLSLRWIPGSLVQKHEDDILSVDLASEIDRYTNFEVVYREGNRTQKAEVQFIIDLEKHLPVASKRIMYGETLSSDDIHYSWVTIASNSEKLVDSEKVLLGKTLRRSLSAGQPIRYSDVASEIIVTAGDDVKLLYRENGILISMDVQARQDGEVDELITFYSEKTRTRYLGRIVNQGVAKWEKTL